MELAIVVVAIAFVVFLAVSLAVIYWSGRRIRHETEQLRGSREALETAIRKGEKNAPSGDRRIHG